MRAFSFGIFLFSSLAMADVQLPLGKCKLNGVIELIGTTRALKINTNTYSSKTIRLDGLTKKAESELKADRPVSIEVDIKEDVGGPSGVGKFVRFLGAYDKPLPVYFSKQSVAEACGGRFSPSNMQEIDSK